MAELVSDAPGAAEKSKETFEPPMSLAQSVFRHGRNPTPASEKEILDLVTQRQMAPYYARVCAAFGISKDESLYAKMKDANAAEIAALAAKKEDAEANQGDMEVLDALFDAARATVAAVHLQPAARQVEREDDAEGAGDEREDHRRDDVGCRVDEVEVPRSRRLF